MTLICATAYANRISEKRPEPHSYIVEQPLGDSVAYTVVNIEDSLTAEYKVLYSKIDRIISRSFVSIAVLGAATYLISNLPGYTVPGWFNIALPCFTYGSAAVFYMSVNKDAE